MDQNSKKIVNMVNIVREVVKFVSEGSNCPQETFKVAELFKLIHR